VRAAPRACHSFWQKQDCSECSHSGCSRCGSLCEPFQHTRCKPVERIDCVGKSATAVACDHRRSRRNSICRGVSRSRGLCRKRKSKGDDRGRSPRVMRDNESIYIYIYMFARDIGHRGSKKVCTTRVAWLMASKLTRGRESSEPPGN
jgi:hypothetical protein